MYSIDGIHWNQSTTVAFTTTVQWSDSGVVERLNRRERPQLLFARDGVTPIMLTNGAQSAGVHADCNHGGVVSDPSCSAFTLGEKLKQR